MQTLTRTGIIAAAAVALSLSSCSVYKEYTRPQTAFADSLYNFKTTDTLTIADIGWKDFFTDGNLQNLIETGLANNTDVRNAAQKTLEAQAALKASGLSFLPSLNLKPSFSLENADRYGGSVSAYNVPGATAGWELDLNGKLYNNRRIALASAQEAANYELTVKTELIAAIANAYYNLEMLDSQLLISESTARNWKTNVLIMQSMKDAGMTNAASVSQTEANSCSIDATLFDLQYRIAKAENDLCKLIGIPYRKIERGKLSDARLKDNLATGVPVQLLSRRPDVKAAEIALRKAFYGTSLARSAFYPSLSISGDWGWEKALTSPAGWAFGAAAGALVPIFNGGRNLSGLKSAQAREAQALNNFRQALLNAGAEVNDALAKCTTSASKTDLRRNQIAALEKAVESTQALMRHSESTYLEVLTAQQSLLSAQLQQISDKYDYVQGIISLYKSLGGGAN